MLLAEALDTVVPDIDPVLASPSACRRMLEVAGGLSRDAEAAYVECRAAPDDDRTDFLACFLSTADPQSSPAVASAGRDDTSAGEEGERGNAGQPRYDHAG